jgi:hypothetical protein
LKKSVTHSTKAWRNPWVAHHSLSCDDYNFVLVFSLQCNWLLWSPKCKAWKMTTQEECPRSPPDLITLARGTKISSTAAKKLAPTCTSCIRQCRRCCRCARPHLAQCTWWIAQGSGNFPNFCSERYCIIFLQGPRAYRIWASAEQCHSWMWEIRRKVAD